MKLSFDRTAKSSPRKPESVSINLVPDPSSSDWELKVESSIERKSTISSLLHAVAKLMPYLSPRKTEPVTGSPMRKLMTASVKNKTLWNNVPEGEEVEQRITFKRVGDRVRVTTYANVSPDCVQASWNVICPVMTPSMVGSESAREICVVADSD